MKQVLETFFATHEVKKSTFLSYLVPMCDFEKTKARLRGEHPKANHIVWAYRTLNEFEQVEENSSDDGEPKGTSGPPCLNVLRGEDIILSGVLVVRYFGGIKLGTGGLVRAYSSSVKEAIKIASFSAYEKLIHVEFEVSFSLMQRFEHFFKTNKFPQGVRIFNEIGALWKMDITQNQKEQFILYLNKFDKINVKFT